MKKEAAAKDYTTNEVETQRRRIAELEEAEAKLKRAEVRIVHLNAVLLSVSRINQLIIREKSREKLLQDACDILVETRGYRLAWIGMANSKTFDVEPVAQAGFEEGYLESIHVTWDDSPSGRGPTGTAIKTRAPSVMCDIPNDPRFAPWREEAVKRGFGSSLAMPILIGDRVWGALNVYSEARDAFDDEEVRLLEELSADIGFALRAMDTEAEKEKLQAQFLHAQKMDAVGRLAGGIAHDLNNILNPILGFSQLAMSDMSTGDPLYQNLEQIYLGAVRAATLVRQLLFFSRRQPAEVALLNINGIIEDLLKMLRRIVEEDIVIRTELDPDPWFVMADRGNIDQIVMNLTINARDAMQGGGLLTLRTEKADLDEERCRAIPGSRPGEFVCLSVADTGVGMDKDIIQRIFEPFFTTKEAGRGTGLGLSIVYSIVDQYKGWITVDSVPGQGSTFRVFLPACPEVPKKEEKEAVSLQSLQGRGEHILLVEDEDSVRHYTSIVLRKYGYAVTETKYAREAMDAFEKEEGNFHMVFSDVVLSDRDGLRLIEDLLARKAGLKVLLCSGYIDEKSNWTLIQERKYTFLQKPYSVADMLQAVKTLLEGAF